MTRRLVGGLAVLLAVGLGTTACSGDDPDPDATGSDRPTTTAGGEPASTPPTSGTPGEPGEPLDLPTTSLPIAETPAAEDVPAFSDMSVSLQSWLGQMRRTDTTFRVTALERCVSRDVTSARCAVRVKELRVSIEAVVLQLSQYDDYPAEATELATLVRDMARTLQDWTADYMGACPEAGATSQACADALVTLLENAAIPMSRAVQAWQPYTDSLLEG